MVTLANNTRRCSCLNNLFLSNGRFNNFFRSSTHCFALFRRFSVTHFRESSEESLAEAQNSLLCNTFDPRYPTSTMRLPACLRSDNAHFTDLHLLRAFATLKLAILIRKRFLRLSPRHRLFRIGGKEKNSRRKHKKVQTSSQLLLEMLAFRGRKIFRLWTCAVQAEPENSPCAGNPEKRIFRYENNGSVVCSHFHSRFDENLIFAKLEKINQKIKGKNIFAIAHPHTFLCN